MKKLDIEGHGMTSQRTRNRLVERLREQGISDQRVLDIMKKMPRHLFLDEAMATRAYEDSSLPIGHGQTISQPYIVARMTELLIADGIPSTVLEVGTGSGYQAAVSGALVKTLHTVEVIHPLYKQSRELLYQLGYRNIHVHHSNGSWGWEKAAPYDAIMATAAPETVPQALLDQLKIGGKLIIPVGLQNKGQELQCIRKINSDQFEKTICEPVQFVPFVSH